jgi:hypothetical protein
MCPLTYLVDRKTALKKITGMHKMQATHKLISLEKITCTIPSNYLGTIEVVVHNSAIALN